MSDIGRLVHLRRLRHRASGRILTIALDHAPSYGLLPGCEDIPRLLREVAAAEPDAIMLMKGTAAALYSPYAGSIPLILKCSTLSPHHPDHDVLVSTIEDGLRLGVDAVSMAVTFGSPFQAEHLGVLAGLVREAHDAGLPVIAHAYPSGPDIAVEDRYSVGPVAYAARAVMELGVDIVKTHYTGSAETFAKVVDAAAPALVVAAGGPRLSNAADVRAMAAGVVAAGAAGLTIGRNVWQSGDVGGTIEALKAIVHADVPVAEAALPGGGAQ